MKQDKKAAEYNLAFAFVFWIIIPFTQEINAVYFERVLQGLTVFFMALALIKALPDSPPEE